MVQTVCLDENAHGVTMLRGVRQMKDDNDLCDFIIKVKDDEYPAHKVILSSGSPYFKAMFKHDTTENREGKVEMKAVDPECVKSCINFLYSGNFDIPDGKIGQLLHVAIMLQLDKVKDAISDILQASLSAENFYEIINIAVLYNLQPIKKSCKFYYDENFMEISAQSGFKNEKKSRLVNIIKSKKMKLSEEEKLTASLRWVGNDLEKKEDLLELIKLISLEDVPFRYLRSLLKNNPFVANDLHLYKLIDAPLVDKVGDSNKDLIVLFDWNADQLRSYDPGLDEMTVFHTENFKHLGDFTAIFMDPFVYILCADKSVHRLNFRDKNSKWESVRRMNGEHGAFPSVVALSGSLFVVGCYDAPSASVEMFVPAVNQWFLQRDKPTPIRNTTLVSLNDSIFCIGGSEGEKVTDSFCRFTPSSSEWVDLEPMKHERYWCGAVAVERRIFVIGGRGDDHDEPLMEVESYDVTSKQWTSLTPMNSPYNAFKARHFDGWIYLVSWHENIWKVEKYDIANDRWCRVEFKDVKLFEIYESVWVRF